MENIEPKNPMHKLRRPGSNRNVMGNYDQPNVGPGKMGAHWANFSCAKTAIAKGVPVIIAESDKLMEDIAATLDGDEVMPS